MAKEKPSSVETKDIPFLGDAQSPESVVAALPDLPPDPIQAILPESETVVTPATVKLPNPNRLDTEDPIAAARNIIPPHLYTGAGDEEIMAMDFRLVCQKLELVERGIKEFNRQVMCLAKYKSDIEKKLQQIGQRCHTMNKVEMILRKKNPIDPSIEIKKFQQAGAVSREARKTNALKFIHAHTTPESVKNALNPKAPIDQAFGTRKPPIGAGRPGLRMPVRIN